MSYSFEKVCCSFDVMLQYFEVQEKVAAYLVLFFFCFFLWFSFEQPCLQDAAPIDPREGTWFLDCGRGEGRWPTT